VVKKGLLLTAAILAAMCFVLASAYSEDTKEDLMAKLTSLRNEKAKLKFEYDSEMHELNKLTEQKMDKIRVDYRVSREQILKEKRQKSREFLKGYEGKLKPMLAEEDGLIKRLGGDEASNFAKTKTEKSWTKKAK